MVVRGKQIVRESESRGRGDVEMHIIWREGENRYIAKFSLMTPHSRRS